VRELGSAAILVDELFTFALFKTGPLSVKFSFELSPWSNQFSTCY
jgi:hypothetical protein